MRLIRNFVGMMVLWVALDSCFNAPEFPSRPEISFNNLIFRDVADPQSADSLILTINFKDGDGDLGLDPSWTSPPYNEKFFVRITNGNRIDTLKYAARRTIPGFDTLPPFEPPYSCTNWDVLKDANNQNKDTIYVKYNPDRFNIFVEFYTVQNINGKDSTTLYDWTKQFVYPNCLIDPFNGRFPVLAKDYSQKSAQEGTIRYAMKSAAFTLYFSLKVLKLKIWIEDQALNKSNVITTEKFTLSGIRK